MVPNGVDCESFRPLDGVEDPSTIVFTGHMGVFHNVDAATHLAEELLPLLQDAFPELRLRIVGASPNERVQALHRPPAVTVTGFVPELNLGQLSLILRGRFPGTKIVELHKIKGRPFMVSELLEEFAAEIEGGAK